VRPVGRLDHGLRGDGAVSGSNATIEYVPWRTRRDDTRVSHRRESVLARIRDTPPGFVRAYGDVSPGAPRFAGAVLAACEDPDVPWHRIVRADGSLAKGERQRRLLAAEGVPFRGARVDMRTARLP
jgi:methylated-DNA-protein-cysteine methyltransferase-like protein